VDEYDDDTVRRLLRPLNEDPPRPSTVDVTALVAAARRRERTRWLVRAGASGAAGLVVLTAVPLAVAATGGADRAEPSPPPAMWVCT
jgi:hypothetical protein